MNKLISVLMTATLLAGCGEVVDAGNRGVSVSNGRVDPKSYPEGFYWYNPFTTTIVEVDVKSKKTAGDMAVITKDLQTVTVSYRMIYSPVAEVVPTIYQRDGLDYANKYIPPAVAAAVKQTLASYTAPQVVSRQNLIQTQIAAALRDRLIKSRINVEQFDLVSIQFSKDYSDAIERKEVAVQRAAAAENEKQVAINEGATKVATARAEAEATTLKAKALQESPATIQAQWIEAWDGKLPDTVYCSSSVPCVTVPTGR